MIPTGAAWDELTKEWVDGRVARGEIQPNSARVQRSRLVALGGCIPNSDIGLLDKKAIQAWQATIGQYSPGTRRLYLSTASMFCRWLVDEGHLDRDPTADVPKIREPRRPPRALNQTQIEQLLAAVDTSRLHAIVWLMVGCGLRCVEVSRLDLDDYDREQGTLHVRGKAWHERIVPAPMPVRKALEGYLRARGTHAGPLIATIGSKARGDGRVSASWLSRRVGRLMVDAGIHRRGDGRSAHALRHTCASDVLEKCKDVRLVQELLGHQSLATTQMYLRRTSLTRMRQAMEGRDYTAGRDMPA